MRSRRDQAAPSSTVVDAVRWGDESSFSGLVVEYRAELRVHCYRRARPSLTPPSSPGTSRGGDELGDAHGWRPLLIGAMVAGVGVRPRRGLTSPATSKSRPADST